MRTLLATLFLTLALAAPALAAGDNGEGLLGETDDKVVTLFSLGVLASFFVIIVVGTVIQSALERRKDQAKATRMRQRAGW